MTTFAVELMGFILNELKVDRVDSCVFTCTPKRRANHSCRPH